MFSPKWILLGLGCAGSGLGVGLAWPETTELDFLSVGQGDCAVFRHEGTTILVDCGPKNPKVDAGSKYILPKLRAMGANGVDLILLSHPDMDHIGGTGSLIKAFPEATVAMSSSFRSNKQLLQLLTDWGKSPNQIRWLGAELEGRVGDFNIHIDCPQTDPDEETNDGSMLVRISSGAASVVFTGDAPSKIESAFSHVSNWTANVLKAGHHGSRTSTSEGWIEAVHPQYVVLSCGLHNEYHHPHKEVLERLEDHHISICRTDLEGDIRFRIENGKFQRVAP